MKRTFALIFFLLALSSVQNFSFSQQKISEDMKALAASFFELTQKHNFTEVSRLFNYPSEYTKEQLSQDMSMVRKMTQLINDQFGEIKRVNPVSSQDSSLQIGVGGGDLPYWEKHPTFIRVCYDVQFANAGSGSIDFYFANIRNKWEIRQVNYGLPVSRADASDLIMKTMQKLSQLTPD